MPSAGLPTAPPVFTPRESGPQDDAPTVAMEPVSITPPKVERAAAEPASARRTAQAGPREPPQAAGAAKADAPATRPCGSCGGPVPAGHVFCGACGARADATAPPAPPVAPARSREIGHLALIDDLGAESVRYALIEGSNEIGRAEANQIPFPQDGLLANTHCIVIAKETPFRLRPVDFCNGTYLRISTPVELQHGDIIRVGQEVLRFERVDEIDTEVSPATGRALTVGCPMPRGVWGRLCQIGMARQVANAYLLSHRDVFLGRERGDILFPKDGFVSGSHAVISERGGRVYLKDLGSSNGTFLRIKREIALRNGDLLLLGRNLLRVHVGAS